MNRCFVYLALSLLSLGAFSQESKKLSIIPLPVSMQVGQGSFTIQSNTEIQIREGQPGLRSIAEQLAKKISRAAGFQTRISEAKNFGNNSIRLEVSNGNQNGNEGYSLTVTPENITIAGDSAAGVFYG